jgi:hypothetical protein
MHASTVTFQIPADKLEQATAGIKQNAQGLRNNPGFQQGYWIYDEAASMVMAVMIFDTAEQAASAWNQSRPRVLESVKSLGGSNPTVRGGVVLHQL